MRRIAKDSFAAIAALGMMLVCGCSTQTPIGVTSLGKNYAYNQIDRSALNSGKLSSYATLILHRHDLSDLYAESPLRAVQALHRLTAGDNRRDALYALAEISFLLGNEGRRIKSEGRVLEPENFYAASVVYSYRFLLGPGEEPPPSSFDRRFRMACDIYNRSLSYILARREGKDEARGREWMLPVGSIVVTRDVEGSDFSVPLDENETYVSADRFRIHGLTVRNRNAGMGAPIIIIGKKKAQAEFASGGSAATVFFRVEEGLSDEKMHGSLGIYSAFARNSIEVNGAQVPLETDLTTHIAYALDDPEFWKFSKMLFRLGEAPVKPGIYPAQPYQAGKIPVLFVHGTMSNPARWAEMWNTLIGDAVLREKFQFWFYFYDSAKPAVQSAAHLRACIQDKVGEMDPQGLDDRMRQMVVIGHSQGGLLAKLTATHTGDALIQATTGRKLSDLRLSPDETALVRDLVVFDPLPQVKRVIFIATPHRGSYQAGDFARRLARRFIRLPQKALETGAELLSIAPKISPDMKLASTSIDTMSPDNPGLLALAEIPVAPPIKAHSIIAVKGDAVPPKGGDGVVKYTSAHIDGVESERIVRSGHSCQGTPMAIEEVRRILLEHLKDAAAQ
jgi:pimeloyl-ACP methyl ester carboxylesterase